MTNVDELWRFIPIDQRGKYERMAEMLGISKGAALALKACHEALRDYCPPTEQVKVAAALARIVAEKVA